MAVATKNEKDFRVPYECLGVATGPQTGNNAKCDCPFCDKEGHFFLNVETGQFDCKVCGKNGNLFDFLEQYTRHCEERTPPAKLRELSSARGLPIEAFTEWGIGWNDRTLEWMLPVYTEKGTVRDVRRWPGKGVYTTDGCKAQLYGMYGLSHTTDRKKRRVWVCEGEWDAIAMHWLIQACGSRDLVVGVPGAGTFKQEWVAYFQDCHVIFAFDNDSSGDDGSKKGAEKLKGHAKRRQFISWPETFPERWDIRDQIKTGLEKRLEPLVILAGIEALLTDNHRRDATGNAAKAASGGGPSPEIGPPCSFAEVLEVFKKWVKMDRDFMDCLITALAVPLANNLPGEPLWFYIVGTPGGGKTLILGSLATTEKCIFYSTFKRESLVSGYNRDPDPSILPQLNGLTAVFKDGTELLTIHPDARREAYSVLRGAYDGRVDRDFGNGVSRRYDDLHFNMLIGVTPAIHGDSQATMGERFLNVEMRENLAVLSDKLYQCVANTSREKQMAEELSAVTARFLNREIDPEHLPKLPESVIHKIVAMAQLVALLRAQVERDIRDRDLKYRATGETGTRVAKQLAKFASVVALLLGKAEVDNDVCRLLRKVMADTSVGFHVDIVKALVRNGNKPMTTAELCATSRINSLTLAKRIEDMVTLLILETERKPATKKGELPRTRYFLTERMMNLWQQSLDGVRRG